jgi:hypothetical protein
VETPIVNENQNAFRTSHFQEAVCQESGTCRWVGICVEVDLFYHAGFEIDFSTTAAGSWTEGRSDGAGVCEGIA